MIACCFVSYFTFVNATEHDSYVPRPANLTHAQTICMLMQSTHIHVHMHTGMHKKYSITNHTYFYGIKMCHH